MSGIVFRAATVIDGTGSKRYRADVRVNGARIERIAGPQTIETSGSDRVIEANGSVLAPGFIDMHAHSDLAVITDRVHLAKLGQGVTTEVLGQDGISYAPIDDVALGQIRRQIAGWNGNPGDDVVSWRTVGQYLDTIDSGVPTNVAYLIPQGNLRILTVGNEDRRATSSELKRMRGLLADGLTAGAMGMSSGLTYVPGMYASTDELASLCEVVAEHGGYFAPHTRSYGVGALDAYAEMIQIARRTGCGLHLTHATLNFATNRDTAPAFLALIDRAIADGVDLTLDSYPYLPGATTLVALLPSWFAAGGPDALLARLRAGTERNRLAHSFDVTGADGFHGEIADWSTIQIVGVGNPRLADCVGRTIAEIAESAGRDATDAVIDILLEDELATGILMHIGHEQNVRAIMRHPAHMGGSDGILVGDRPHPRGWGTFPRFLARYVRELGIFTLEEAIRHLTCSPARRLGLTDRGVIREGYVADLVLFHPGRIRDAATFDQPRTQAEGIDFVLVNGQIAIDQGRRTGSIAGHALRRDRLWVADGNCP